MWAVDEAMEHHRQMGLDLIDEARKRDSMSSSSKKDRSKAAPISASTNPTRIRRSTRKVRREKLRIRRSTSCREDAWVARRP
jgi:hypothetical protein